MQSMVHQDTPVLDIDNVSKTYMQWQRSGKVRDIIKNMFQPEKREIHALKSLSLHVRKGEFVAYAGANGAGKSTTLKILSGIIKPTSGEVRVLSMEPGKDRIELMKRIGILFGQRTELWWDHPVITSYEWKKTVWGIQEELYQKNLALVTELLGLDDILHTFARELSLGQRMKADLGMLLLHSPEVIFLDEPTLGLDVLAKRQMIGFLKKINREQGVTIIVTSHDMDDLEEMADRIVLLSKGEIAFDGDFEELRQIQSGCSRISITSVGTAPRIEGLTLITSEECIHEYEFDKSKTSIHEILGKLSEHSEIEDVEVKKAPIEQVITNLYLLWK